jgi:2-hydroxycyclohexanecarboxyl-CoA dehydrogenase
VSDDDLLNLNGKVARYLAAHGASVAVNDFYADRAEEVAAEIRKDGGDALGVQADVTDYASVLAMTSAVAERLGPVTVLVNNAGNARRHPWRDRPQAILGK